MFRQIYELTVLDMHPAILYPRRSQIRPRSGGSERSSIVRHCHADTIPDPRADGRIGTVTRTVVPNARVE